MKQPTNQNIGKIRHSLSHIMAHAVQDIFKKVKFGIGPTIENGFYYDFDLPRSLKDEDLPKIEKRMKELIAQNIEFKKSIEAPAKAKKRSAGQPYKLKLINELIKEKKPISYYTSGEFNDLCGGPHVKSSKEIPIDSFKLTKTAGAYWQGDEKNKMLTRIYGVAFESRKELDEYLKMIKEAEKRDHRKLGKELDLFVFSDVVGKGLPLWTEKGAVIRRELERFIVDEEIKRGYKHVYTPDIAKIDLYKKSGHYPYYKDSMYAPIKIDEEEFMLRPMSCPHHFELYLSRPRSYRELPMRIAEIAKLYRYEQSGELTGLIRVRNFCLADAHIICADKKQAQEEVREALALIEYVSNVFGLKKGKDYWYRLSLGDRKDEKKYYKGDKAWDGAEQALREILQKNSSEFVEAEGEATFYGPKIDIQMKNVYGKEDTAFTVQYDFVMPERFNLVYKDSNGKNKKAIVVHRSSVGALERVVAFLIEHYAGAFPTWLSPTQVYIIPVGKAHFKYSEDLGKKLTEEGLRVEVDLNRETVGYKIRKSEKMKVPYMLVIGDKEVKSKSLNVRIRGQKAVKKMTQKAFEDRIQKEITERK